MATTARMVIGRVCGGCCDEFRVDDGDDDWLVVNCNFFSLVYKHSKRAEP